MTIEHRKRSAREPGAATLLLGSAAIAALVSTIVGVFSTASLGALTAVAVIASLLGADVLRGYVVDWEPFRPRYMAAAYLYFFVPITSWCYFLMGRTPDNLPAVRDWEGSLERLLWLYVLGILFYVTVVHVGSTRFASQKMSKAAGREGAKSRDERAAPHVWLLAAAVVSLAIFAVMVVQMGGIDGYVNSMIDRQTRVRQLDGRGPLLILAEAWPMLLVLAYVSVRVKSAEPPHWLEVAFVLLGFVLVQFAVGGLRGSRANTVWPTLIVVGVFHLTLYRVSRLAVLLLALAGSLFAYAYGIYKALGVGGAKALLDGQQRAVSVSATGRDAELVFLEDFGRLGVQAVVVDHRSSLVSEFQGPPNGLPSYLGDMSFLLPNSLAPADLWSKTEYGTSLFYGSHLVGTERATSRIFGFVGEAMLNWGTWVVPLSVAVYALIVTQVDRLYQRANTSQDRSLGLFAGSLGVLLVVVFVQDLDNVAWFCLKYMGPIALAALLMKRDSRRKDAGRGI